MTTIPLTHGKHLIPFATFMRKNGEPVERLMQKSRLPSSCLDNPEMLIPSDAAFHFRELAARVTGLPNVALESTKGLEVANLGDFGQILLHAPTLGKMLTEFCRLAPSQTSMTSFAVKQRNDGDVSFCYHFDYSSDFDLWHNDLYILQWILKVVRLVDPEWAPKGLCFSAMNSVHCHQALEMLGVSSAVSYGHPWSCFTIPSSMLALPLREIVAWQKKELPDIDLLSSAPGKSYSEALQQVLRSYAADRWLSVNEASECVGASMRTLQRRLSTEQTSYSRVLEQARAEMASELLESTEACLADIAHELGYPSPGNFTRAFRRWSGVSPSEFRHHRKP
jgi:AraC-like DNA-binding protein